MLTRLLKPVSVRPLEVLLAVESASMLVIMTEFKSEMNLPLVQFNVAFMTQTVCSSVWTILEI